MQPFSINCVTCKSKLTVSKPALLGQILACPKCSSMVQIPAEPTATQTGEVTTQTTNPLAQIGDSQPSQQAPQHTVEDFGYQSSTSELPDDDAVADSPASAAEDSPEDTAVEQESPSSEQPALWVDSASKAKQKKLLIAFAGITALVLITVIISFSLTGDKQSGELTSNQADDDPLAEQDAVTQPGDENDLVELDSEPDSEEEPTEQVNVPPEEESSNETPPDAVDPMEETADPSEPQENAPKDPMDSTDKLPVGPAGLTPQTPDKSATDDMSKDLDSVIDNVAPFLSNAPITIDNAAPVVKLPMANAESPRQPAAPVNIERGLNFTVSQIDIANPVPLNQFLEFLGTLGNIPFTFDLESLELIQQSYAVGVQHTSENQTIEQILTAVLTSLQLTHQIEDGHVTILAQSHTDPAITTSVYKREQMNVARDKQAAEQLSQILNTLLAQPDTKIAKPVVDEDNAEIFHVEVSATNRMHDRVKQLLTRLADTDATAGSHESAAWPQYQKPYTMNFADGAPLLQVLIYLNSNSELRFQANWKNIWQSGWTPKSQVNVATEGEPLLECLDQTLTKNGLSYIARTNGVLEITTTEHALVANQIGLYDLSKMPVTRRDALVKTLDQLATAEQEDQKELDIRLIESLPDGRLALSAPAVIHRLVARQLK